MTVYLDTLIIINTYISWLTLSLCERVAHIRSKPLRLAIGSFIGGMSSLLILIETNSIVASVSVMIIKLSLLIAVALTVFYEKEMGLRRIFETMTIYVIVNIVFGGAAYLFKELFDIPIIYYNSSSFYIDVSLADTIIMTAVIYLLLTLAAYFTSRRTDIASAYHVGICIGDESFILEGVADTGNTVSDIFSGKPVVICTGIDYNPPGNARIHAVPYRTVNGEGLLYAFSPDSFYIEDEKGNKRNSACLVAFTEGQGKRAIFNPVLLK